MPRYCLAICLLILLGRLAPAQDREPPPKPLVPHPLERKELAKAKRAAVEAEPGKLAEEKLASAQIHVDSRMREFWAGRGTLEFLDEALRDQRDARLALAETEAERVRAWEEFWFFARRVEEVNRFRFEAGRIPTNDYLQSIYWRQVAELQLAQFRSWPGWISLVGTEWWGLKELARAKHSAARATAEERALQRLDTIQGICAGRMKNCLAGRCTLDFLLRNWHRLLHSELAAARTDADRLAAYAFHWEAALRVETMNRARYENGRIPIQDYAQSADFLFHAEAALVQARATFVSPTTAAVHVGFWDHLEGDNNPFHPEAKLVARAKQKTFEADLRQLAQQQFLASQIQYDAREREFFRGRGTLDFIIESAERLVETELALLDNERARLEALGRHWARLKAIEMVNRKRFIDARIPIQDYEQSRYHLLQAALMLNEAWRSAAPR